MDTLLRAPWNFSHQKKIYLFWNPLFKGSFQLYLSQETIIHPYYDLKAHKCIIKPKTPKGPSHIPNIIHFSHFEKSHCFQIASKEKKPRKTDATVFFLPWNSGHVTDRFSLPLWSHSSTLLSQLKTKLQWYQDTQKVLLITLSKALGKLRHTCMLFQTSLYWFSNGNPSLAFSLWT